MIGEDEAASVDVAAVVSFWDLPLEFTRSNRGLDRGGRGGFGARGGGDRGGRGGGRGQFL